MLNKQDILNIAIGYLNTHGHPIIVSSASVVFPNEENNPESKEFLSDYNLACISFHSNFPYNPDDPRQELVPGVFIVYVNYITGEVRMPRHMA